MAAYDFAVQVNATPTGYAVRATAPSGQAQADVLFPLSPLELENQLQAVELSLLRGRGGLRRALSDSDVQTQDLGKTLYDFLFSGDVRALFDLSRLESERGEGRLRLLLSVEPAELASLPWELLYHSREGEFLALSQATPVVRLRSAPYAQQALIVTPPLRVLGVIASPKGWEPLNVGEEQARLERAFAPLQEAGLAELVWMDGQDWRALQSALRSDPWHIIHFIGHGGFDKGRDEGYIVLCDDAGEEARLYAVELARLVADHASLRLVFLNACEGATASQDDDLASSAAALVRRSVPAVVAMQYPISDRGAIEFARTFYESLVDNLLVDAAVTEARKAVSLASPHSPEWATPVLFLAAQDGQLFSLEESVASSPTEGTVTLPDGLSNTQPTVSDGDSRGRLLFWLLPLLVILAFVTWQVWHGRGDGTTAAPAAVVATGAPTTPATSETPMEDAEYQAGTATAMAEESATSAALTPTPRPDPGVLLHVTFDDQESIGQPLVGSGGATNLPVDAFVDGFLQAGAHINQRGQFVRFPVEGNISLEAGEIELGYRPNFDYGDSLPSRNEHALVVVGDIYNPPHLLLMMSDRLQMIYRADWEQDYSAESFSPALPWTKGDWLHIRAVWDRSSPDNAFQLYINDTRVDITRSGGGWPLPGEGQADALWIGSGQGDLDADGVIDELIVRGVPAQP